LRGEREQRGRDGLGDRARPGDHALRPLIFASSARLGCPASSSCRLAASLAELHFGTLVAGDDEERARRALRLGVIESTFEPLPIDAAVAREWGRLAAAVRNRGGQSRRRALDLAIAATANAHRAPLLTHNAADFNIIDDLVDIRTP
jgi:predicted nucleic acid-binding protein